jgi:ABC-2 type transport system ATP-binding protein
MSVKVENLKKVYGEQIAVNSINFEIAKGEIVGFLGPNGAGKSTTMKMITGYVPATEGSAFVCGKEVSENRLGIQKKIGYLPESNPLYMDMYIREYLEFLAGVHQLGNQSEKRINEIIEATGLKVEEKKKIGDLSKGYKQRIGIAQAMIHNPEVLILDEPTSGLDPNQIVEIRDLIKNFGRDKTVILSTHIMQEVEAMCDRVIIINKGTIVVDSNLKELQQKYPDQTLETIFRNLTLN